MVITSSVTTNVQYRVSNKPVVRNVHSFGIGKQRSECNAKNSKSKFNE